MLSITALVENTANRLNLLAEHGLAFWIERDGRRILFDTGQGLALQHNAAALGIDLSTVDDIALSHGHYDHTGGLAVALPNFSRARVYAHLSAFRTRFVKDPDGKARAVGSQIESRDWLSSRVGQSIATRGGPVNLGGGVWLTGEIPRENDYEDTGGAFYLDEACTEPDPVIDDQAMFFETAKGLVVLLGCAHAGVINTLKHIQAATGQAHIHAVLGGMHLLAAGERRMTETVKQLSSMNIERVGLSHCTGFAAMARLHRELPDRCFHCVTGTRMVFD
ncbi:MAG: MBL fold metallo-hydrolase [Planctomycetes bacterium]|nr:MBL fold metallo-hydrolase [Planctomycetota bacterium]